MKYSTIIKGHRINLRIGPKYQRYYIETSVEKKNIASISIKQLHATVDSLACKTTYAAHFDYQIY